MPPHRIDLIRPDAPALAAFGAHPVGVRTLHLTHPAQIDVARSTPAAPALADRHLTVELWYPAAAGSPAGTAYHTLLRDGETPVTLHGRACRDAPPATGRFALVILSHGYPGNRYLLGHLGENLASKGYVVASVDHAGSTYDDLGPFGATLLHRPLDQRFVLDHLAADPVLAFVDADRTAVIGYSMGGYGALVLAGAGLTAAALARPDAPPPDALARHLAGSARHAALADPRLRAVVAIAPWGRHAGVFDAGTLAGLTPPLLILAGSADDVTPYASLRQIFAETRGTTRHLLTFQHANHNAAAPIPAPPESWPVSARLGWAPFEHYADPVWDTLRMNNIAQHFVTAFLDLHLKGDAAKAAVLTPGAAEWPGFAPRTTAGLRLETAGKGFGAPAGGA